MAPTEPALHLVQDRRLPGGLGSDERDQRGPALRASLVQRQVGSGERSLDLEDGSVQALRLVVRDLDRHEAVSDRLDLRQRIEHLCSADDPALHLFLIFVRELSPAVGPGHGASQQDIDRRLHVHDQVGQRHEPAEALEVGLREGRVAVDEELIGGEDDALIDEERGSRVRSPRHLVHTELAHHVPHVVEPGEGGRGVPPQPVEREPEELAIAIEGADERRKGGHVGEEVDRVRVVDPSKAEPVRQQIRRHPHRPRTHTPAHEPPRQGRLAGSGGPDELDDHRVRAMPPTRGASSR
jgi:hypothetical protein